MAALRRLRLGTALATVGAVLLHCRWVLLNGASVPYRLWTVLGVSRCPPRAVEATRSPRRTGRHGRVSVRADNGARSDGTGSVGAFPPFLWTFLFKQAKHIPSDIRPPVRRDNLSRREGGNRPRFPLRLVQES